MEEVLPQALPSSTNTAVVAMIDVLVGMVIPKLADVTEVPGSGDMTVGAAFRSLLGARTQHAKHIFGVLPNELVVLDGVMAESARVPLGARRALKLDVASVMLTAKRAGFHRDLIFRELSGDLDRLEGYIGRPDVICRHCEIVG